MFCPGAVGKAIEVEDKAEGAAIRNSIRTAFIKMSGGSQNKTKVTQKADIVDTHTEDNEGAKQQQAKVTVHLSENRGPVVTLINK